MRLLELHLKAFGPFTDRVLSLGDDHRRLVLVHGLNEAGKSSTLRAITALRYGIPDRTADAFLHDYASLRVGGVFVDPDGQRHGLMRRKGRGVTLKAVDFDQGGAELPEPVAPAVVGQLTAGLRAADHDTLFGLDHARLREGGAALERGDGELGAALFEASSGTVDVNALLEQLNERARKLFNPAVQSRTDKFKLALADWRQQAELQRGLSVRASRWEQLQRDWTLARQALEQLTAERQALLSRQATVKELIAVGPTLGELARCEQGLAALADVRLLDENAATERAAAQAALAQALADTQAAADAAREASERQSAAQPDSAAQAVLSVENAIGSLRASAQVIDDYLAQQAQARADLDAAHAALARAARTIAPEAAAEDLLRQLPPPALRARLSGNMEALGRAEQALQLHEAAADLEPAAVAEVLAPPDAAAVSALRQAVDQCQRHAQALDQAPVLARAVQQARRDAETGLASLQLADEAAARAVVPLLGSAIDQVGQGFADLAAERREWQRRQDETARALAEQRHAIAGLTEHGPVPTVQDVESARRQRAQEWRQVRGAYIDGDGARPAEPDLFARDAPLVDAYEAAVAEADRLVDGIVGDHERASRLSAARRMVAELEDGLDSGRRAGEALDAEHARQSRAWQETLARAGMPALDSALVREWQARHRECLAQWSAVASGTAELEDIERLRDELRACLRAAVNRLAGAGIGEAVGADESLATLEAVAQDGLREVAERQKARDLAAGQRQQRDQQQRQRAQRGAELRDAQQAARAALDADAPALGLLPGAALPVFAARLGEFAVLQQAGDASADAARRFDGAGARLQEYAARAEAVAAVLGEPAPVHLNVAAERWQQRLADARTAQAAARTAAVDLQNAQRQAADADGRARRHQAAIARLCEAAGVAAAEQLPEAEAQSQRKRALRADNDKALAWLAAASRRSREALESLREGRDAALLQDEEASLEVALGDIEGRLDLSRQGEEAARLALAAVDASDAAAEAADAMERAAAAMRGALDLQMRLRLAHGLLKEAVRRFKQRTQAPMLRGASEYFAAITGGDFEGIASDDSEARPVIVGLRAGGRRVPVAGMSEGTRDQLYLALRLAALDLQRDRGVDLPLVLDDVLMTSDDGRAACVLRALALFARRGQVIVFTHHRHLCDVARRCVSGDELSVVEL